MKETKKTNKRFGKLLKEGISSVANREGIRMGEVKSRIGEALGFTPHNVQHWLRGHLPKEADVAYLVRYCVKNGRVGRAWAESLFHHAYYADPKSLLDELFPSPSASRVRLFLSYQRDVEPDHSLALRVAQALTADYTVFFDQAPRINQQSVERLQGELSQADRVIFLFSAESIHSEVVLRQLEMVQTMKKWQEGRACVLPVWLAYSGGFAQARRSLLDFSPVSPAGGRESLNWALWQSEEDTPQLIKELKQALTGGELPLTADRVADLCAAKEYMPSPLPTPIPSTTPIQLQDGTLPADCPFYVEREADRLAHATIAQQGVTITIKGARQMGKSSLLHRLGQTAAQLGKHFVWLDCQLLHSPQKEAKSFFHNFCDAFTDEVGLAPSPNPSGTNTASRPNTGGGEPTITSPWRCTKYVARQLLPRLEQPCVLALDSAESLFDTSYRDAFFSMLRTWHNNRASRPIWSQLDLVVVTSTEPYYFIDNLHQSPFNVGEVIELQDFTSAEVAELNQRHGAPLTAKEEAQLMSLLHGHPYLVRRTLYLVASQRMTASDLFARASDERGPFGDHLRALLWLLQSHDKALRAAMLQVLRKQSCPDEKLFFCLRGAGLVRRLKGEIVPRCPLYADFLQEHLNE